VGSLVMWRHITAEAGEHRPRHITAEPASTGLAEAGEHRPGPAGRSKTSRSKNQGHLRAMNPAFWCLEDSGRGGGHRGMGEEGGRVFLKTRMSADNGLIHRSKCADAA
jgi:hypothetical protein